MIMTSPHEQGEGANPSKDGSTSSEETVARLASGGEAVPTDPAQVGLSATDMLQLHLAFDITCPKPDRWDQTGLEGQSSIVFAIVADAMKYVVEPGVWSTDVLLPDPQEPGVMYLHLVTGRQVKVPGYNRATVLGGSLTVNEPSRAG